MVANSPLQLVFAVRRAVAAIGIATFAWSCSTAGQAKTAPRAVRIMTSNVSGDYYAMGRVLADVYNDLLPDVRATLMPPGGGNVGAVDDGSAEIAFASAEVVYDAFVRGTPVNSRPHRHLRGIAVLFTDALQIVVPRSSRIQTVADLRGARIGLTVTTNDTPARSAGRRFRLIELVTAAHGLSPRDFHIVPGTPDELREAMLTRKIDAWLILAGYPIQKISSLSPGVGLRLLDVGAKAASEIRAQVPFYKPVVIPAETYPGQDTPVKTIGSENLLVGRSDLDDELVYRLTKTLFDALPRLAEAHAPISYVDPVFAAATPIPLHPGAAQYYRERQLLH
jgi:TRAP transporter TAXI family solute receptor